MYQIVTKSSANYAYLVIRTEIASLILLLQINLETKQRKVLVIYSNIFFLFKFTILFEQVT